MRSTFLADSLTPSSPISPWSALSIVPFRLKPCRRCESGELVDSRLCPLNEHRPSADSFNDTILRSVHYWEGQTSVQAQQHFTEEGLPAEPQQRAGFPLGVPGLLADVAGRSGVPPRLSREGKLELARMPQRCECGLKWGHFTFFGPTGLSEGGPVDQVRLEGMSTKVGDIATQR